MTTAYIDVCSPAAGLIHQIEVTIGSTVARGDEVMSLAGPGDAALAPVPIQTPRAGRVVEILVKEGDAVQLQQVVARIQEPRRP